MSNNADASICFAPKTFTITSRRWVPVQELRQRNAICRCNSSATLALLYKVEFVAVSDHVGLRGLRRRDAIARIRRRRCRGWNGCGVFTNDAYACVCLSPEAGATAPSTGVPGEELGERDAVLRGDVGAVVFSLYEVKLVAVRGDGGLSWKRSCDAVAC
jgi:hypothetical protein